MKKLASLHNVNVIETLVCFEGLNRFKPYTIRDNKVITIDKISRNR